MDSTDGRGYRGGMAATQGLTASPQVPGPASGRDEARRGAGPPPLDPSPAAPPGIPEDRVVELADYGRAHLWKLRNAFPGWRFWRDSWTGIWHARRRTDGFWQAYAPGARLYAVSDATPAGLRAQIVAQGDVPVEPAEVPS